MKKKMSPSAVFVAISMTVLLLGGSQAQADEPRLVSWKIVKAASSGAFVPGAQVGGDDQVAIELFAAVRDGFKDTLFIHFPECGEDPKTVGRPVLNLDRIIQGRDSSPKYGEWKDPGPRWRMCPEENTLILSPGKTLPLNVVVDFLRSVNEKVSPRLRGLVYNLTEEDLKLSRDPHELALLVRDRQPTSSLVIDLYYALRSRDDTWVAGDYRKIFGAPYRGKTMGKPTSDYNEQDTVLPVEILAYRSDLKLPGRFRDDDGVMFKRTLERIYSEGSGEAGENVCVAEEISIYQRPAKMIELDEAASPAPASHILTGRFSTKWSSDHSLHPGFGFRVEAWTNETGSWKILASDWVQSGGNWELQVPASKGYLGQHLRVLYRSYNSYYQPKDRNGNTYSWKDPDRYNIPSSYDSGHRYADTDGGDYNGVGELVEAAMRMWSRLYWNAGVNPVPASPITLFFPNTWYDCGDGSGVPWSCASKSSGEIWLIAAHGIQAEVVSHELGHQLNNKFWNNKRPANSGGNHSLDNCYPARLGMALREGFANFIPAWVGYQNRNVAEGGFSTGRWALDYDPERRLTPPNCANGWENEVWVARTFWDLHDTRSDGDDILWFNHRGAVIALYLANGIASDGDARDMRDYETVYRAAATPGHEGFISDIFNQNHM